jgi:hypothetical protein
VANRSEPGLFLSGLALGLWLGLLLGVILIPSCSGQHLTPNVATR